MTMRAHQRELNALALCLLCIAPAAGGFNNPTHDFPTTVSYASQGAEGLTARISGMVNGKERAIEFRYRRVSCP